MKKVLITRKLPKIAKEILEKKFQVTEFLGDSLSKEKLQEIVQEYDAVLSTIPDKFTKEVLEKATHLEVLSNYAIGLDNIDVEFAKTKDIAVYNLPDVVTNSTADLTFAIFLSLIRKIEEARKFVREDQWKSWDANLFLGEELFGKTLGILGFGRIGKAIARRAFGFGLKVIFAHRSELVLDKEFQGKAVQVSKEELFKNSDYISLNVPLNEQTRGMIDLSSFSMMKKSAVLINVARGAVVKTDDLVKALQEKMIRAAALDVTDPEPISGNHPLCQMENCLIVPHIGTSTNECRYQMAKKAAEKIFFHYEKG